jgi:HK97 family phage major capsid protein
MNMTTAAPLGTADNLRRERLLEIASAIAENRSAKLAWPDQTVLALEDNRRDLTGNPGTARQALALGQQLRQHSAIARAGASFITLPILQDSALPSINRASKAAWGAAAADIGAGTIDLTDSTPHRLSAYIVASKQLLKNAPMLAASYIEAQLLSAIGAALDDGAINGDGTGDSPVGLLADTGVAEYEMAGASIAVADLIGMEQAIADAHGENGLESLAWLVDPATRAALRALPRMASGTTPCWPDSATEGPLGIRGHASPWAPAATCTLGRFEDLLVLQSDTVEISPNPYSQDTQGFVRILIQGYFDIVALNPAGSFLRAFVAE